MMNVSIRPASADDAVAVAALYQRVFAANPDAVPGLSEAREPAGFAIMLQTGHAFLVGEAADRIVAAVRHRDEEGIAFFDLLASELPRAGRQLTRRVDQLAQDRGIRLVRTRVPEEGRLADVFARWGYLPIARHKRDDGSTDLELEKRVPLLTVRDQRRSDAEAIGEIAGIDPWTFTQGTRPGWFVLADGDRVAGVISVSDEGGGIAKIMAPVVLPGYVNRGLELWMLERAAMYAETNGYHSATVPAAPVLAAHERVLEDRRWFRDGDAFIRRFRDLAPDPEDQPR